jgi:hypothetical protein
VNLAVNSPSRGYPGWSVGARRVPLRIRPAGDRVRHVTPLAAVFGGIRDTVVTPLGSVHLALPHDRVQEVDECLPGRVHLLLLGAAAHYADGRPPYSRELGAVLPGRSLFMAFAPTITVARSEAIL